MSFQPHVELLQAFLGHRDAVVERIQGLLNAQRKPVDYLQDRSSLSRHFDKCFFTLPGIAPDHSRLKGQLDEALWANGFRPRAIPGLRNGLADPAEMLVRAFHLWEQTRWPGRSGRVRYAHTLFNLNVIRCLALLSLRLWDAGSSGAGDRLSQVQRVLDQLWATSPTNQPVLVRDARWLIPLAQSPATEDLEPYFEIAQRIAETLSEEDRLEVQKAGVRMAGGHLRSQIHHFAMQRAVSLDEERLVVGTRTANALDLALLVQDLVPLLEAYEDAWQRADDTRRLELAGVICQGVSPDPELFLHRLELLAAYSMIEHLFITTDRGGHAALTPMGQRHVRLAQEYAARIGRVVKPLSEDCPHFRPVAGAYSPYGALYGFSSDLLEHMALKASQPDAETRFGLEDVFVEGEANAERLAWVSGWRHLPHIPPDVQAQFAYPQQFAEDVFDRIQRALSRRASGAEGEAAVSTGRLFVVSGDDPGADSRMSAIPALPAHYVESSDAALVAAGKAERRAESEILGDRREGKYVVSCQTAGGWVGVTKSMLTEVLGAGRDVTLAGLPPAAGGGLTVMCPELLIPPASVR